MGTKASLVVPNQRRKAHYPVLAGDRDGSLTRKQRFERPDVSSAECLDVRSVESLKTQRDVPSSLLKYKMSEQEPDTCLRAMPIQWSCKSHPNLPEVGRVGTEENEGSEGAIGQKFKCKITVVPLKLKMDKILVHAKHNGLRMKEGFKYFFNGELMLHFKSVQFKLW